MLYYLLRWIEEEFAPQGFQVFEFTTVRAALAAATALFIAMAFGGKLIDWLRNQQIGERVREGEDAGAVSHAHKAGTPTMGGVILLAAMIIATLLWAKLGEVYVWLILLATVWMGAFGFADDYIKVVKKDKKGLSEKFKLLGQITMGLIVGAVLYFHPQFADVHTLTDLPFFPRGGFDYDFLSPLVGADLGWLIYIPIAVFVVTAVSNAVNLTDGLDGLTTGVSAFVALGLVALCFVSGNAVLADFLNILFLPGAGELTIFAAAMAAACFGFLWYNGYPAQVFMGDTGSLSLGAAIGALALMVHKELLLPLLCGVFFIETLSVIVQTAYFKYTRRKYGEGRRIFRMAPLHHHYEAGGMHEAKIVTRFWIVTAVLVIFTILALRIR